MSPHSLGWSVFLILITTLCQNIGSRPLGDGKSTVGHFEGLPAPEPAEYISPTTQTTLIAPTLSVISNESLSSSSSGITNPCSLVFPPVDGSGDGIKSVSLEEKAFVHLSHPLFEVGKDVVPGVLYQVNLEIPIESEFSLEYWVSGGLGDESRPHLKRRHQRERKEVQLIELFPDPVFLTTSLNATTNAGNPERIPSATNSTDNPFLQPISCSKNSVGGINYYRDETSKSFTFKWFLKNSYIPAPTVIFRLRFRLITEASSSVYEQLLSVPVRPECYLRVKVGESTKLSLSSLWTPHDPSSGLNCTILLSPKPGFGLEARFTNLSIYGIRELCQGRFLSFTVPETHEPETGHPAQQTEFTSLISPINRQYCGKIEDYTKEERLLTFSPSQAGSDRILLRISLPGFLKPKETFSLQLTSLSPCQKVLLSQIHGSLKYASPEIPGADTGPNACSIVIHVPYGNSIETEVVFSRGPLFAHKGRWELGENVTEAPAESLPACPNAQTLESDPDYLVLQVVDTEQSRSFSECIDGKVYSFHRSKWKTGGNKVRITFELKSFDHFSLSYKSIPNPELTQACDEGWVALPDSAGCLTLVEIAKTWPRAEEDCQAKGGHLVTVRNDLVQRVIQQTILESALFHPSRAYWIGANDRESEGNFQWTSGLPFIFTNWFSGWSHKGNEVVNAQPNDDGFSGQDCVELRQTFSALASASSASLGYYAALLPSSARKGDVPFIQKLKHYRRDSFHWNDRNCEVKNFFLCEKMTYQQLDYACNRTLRLGVDGVTIPVTSPAYPSTYPDNTHCVTTVETSLGHRIIVEFDEFLLEDSPSCKYDFLEIVDDEIEPSKNQTPQSDKVSRSTILCGDWSKRLKLLRYTSKGSILRFKFESDFSHHHSGFKAKVWAEKVLTHRSYDDAVTQQCQDEEMVGFGSHCYRVLHAAQGQRWRDAQDYCTQLKGSLTSVMSREEWRFLTQALVSSPDFDKKATYWLGGSIDHTNQLVWADRMPFNFSVFHPSDLKSISEWKCLSLYWHDGGKGTFAWRLSDCNQFSGYICKKNTQVDSRPSLNRTFSGTGGSLTSPNYPSAYYNNLDYTNQLTAPPGTQIIVQFRTLDLEYQEDCLYDFLEIMDRRTRNSTRVCGSHPSKDLNKFDFVSSSNGVDISFHSDFSKNFTGYEIVWRAVDVTECLSGRTIMTGLEGNGFPVHPATIHTPNFPYFNLPGLNCVYTIVAPAGQRIYLHFDIFEIGEGRSSTTGECDSEDDNVMIHLTGDADSPESGSSLNQIRICGNLTSTPHQASFISYSEKMVLRVFSPSGRTGRGFLGKFKAVPGSLSETISMSTVPNTSYPLTSLNHPLLPPLRANLTLDFISPPNYVLTVRVQGNAFHNCHLTSGAYVVIYDPYVGTNGTSWTICDPDSFTTAEEDGRAEAYRRLGMPSEPPHLSSLTMRSVLAPIQSSLPITFRSTFNRLEMTQVYTSRFQGSRWNAEISTTIDEDFRAKVLAGGDRLLLHNACTPNPCTNGGKCVTEGDKYICRCQLPYTGPFCGLSVCDLNPCRFGECFVEDSTFRCVCQMGYGGERCDRTSRPCDGRPCSGHGECVEVTNSTYKCNCHAFWEGPGCEARMQQIPFRPLSERMLREPFWLGIITVTAVMGVIGICWCFKRHFPEKLEKLLNEDPERNRGISWVSGRSPSSIRIGGGSSVRESVPGTSQLATSPQTSRTFLGRFGIRKPSLLSLSSATSVSAAATSPHTYENRTFSLDDLLRPSRSSMMRTPSPHRRRNFSIHGRRDPVEKQQMLQQLMATGGSQSVDGEFHTTSKPSTPKPTIAEIIQMSEKRLRLASMAQQQIAIPPSGDEKPATEAETDHEHETSFTTLTPTSKAEKKVTFARLLDKLAATERSSSSSDSDSCCAEEGCKTVMVHPKPPKKERKGRFRRSRPYNRGRNSETDQDGMEMSSSDTTPDPICPPRFPSRIGSGSPTGLAVAGNSPSSSKPGSSKSLNKMASADSLLALFRRFSGSSSAPPSPQYSENEESSTGATPLSTPSSPRNSSLSLNFRPPAFLITTAEPNTFELPVIDPFGNQAQSWRTGGGQNSNSITLEVPMRDYCLSPIHEVPTPLPTPSHSPAHTPMMHRNKPNNDQVPTINVQVSSEAEEEHEDRLPRRRTSSIPTIAISEITSDGDGNESDQDVFEEVRSRKRSSMTGETEVIPDVLIHVPPDAPLQSNPNSDLVEETRFSFDITAIPQEFTASPGSSPRLKTKPPPLVFANQILSYVSRDELSSKESKELPKIEIPVLNVEYATPIAEIIPNFLNDYDKYSRDHNLPDITSFTAIVSRNPWETGNPLAPPMIMINQSSEAESDSDTPTMRKLLRKPNMMFLSPFAGTSDRVPSESNLSTSGYSSMASPCHSRCPSVSPLCPDSDEFHGQGGHYMRRSSLTPSSSRKSSLTGTTPRRFSLNATSPLVSSGGFMNHCSNYISFAEPCNNLMETERETETDSAVEVETDVDAEPAQLPLADAAALRQSEENYEFQISTTPKISSEMGSMTNLLQVPRPKTLPKSRSLDMNVTALGTKLQQLVLEQRRGIPLRGDSLDSKLNSFDRTSPRPNPSISFLNFTKLSKRNPRVEAMELQVQKKLTPLSSRSESPLSELNAGFRERVPGGLTSPMTDSDGPYDCASSEVQSNSGNARAGMSLNLNQLSPSQQIRRSGRRRNRRMSGVTSGAKGNKNSCGLGLSPDSGNKRTDSLCLNLNLPPSLAREHGLGGSRKGSPKRRTRAQPNLNGTSSSSAESINSQRSHGSTSSMLTQESVGTTADKPTLVLSSSPSSRSGSKLRRSPNVSCEDFTKSGSSIAKDQQPELNYEVPGTSSSGITFPKAVTPPLASRRKVSRLRVIGLQIRFLRRLEQSLIRKREKMSVSGAERRDCLLLSRTESLDSSLSSGSSCSLCSSSCSTGPGAGTSSGTSVLSKFPSSTSIRDHDCNDDNDEEEDDGTEQPLLTKSSSFSLLSVAGRKKSRKLKHTLSQSSLFGLRKKYK